MGGRVKIASVYSLDDLAYTYGTHRTADLELPGAEESRVVYFGRRTDRKNNITVPMIREKTDPPHPKPAQISSLAGSVWVDRGGVRVGNLSIRHPLYVRKWPGTTNQHSLAARGGEHDAVRAATLSEGIWWIATSNGSGALVPGWILIEVYPVVSHVAPSAAPIPGPFLHGEPRTDTLTPRRVEAPELDNDDLRFLVASFEEFLQIPPIPNARMKTTSKINATNASNIKNKIVRAARPEMQRTDSFAKLYTPSLLVELVEKRAPLTFGQVQAILNEEYLR